MLWPSLNVENATRHMEVRANFGQEPFRFNIADHFGLSQAKTQSNGIHLPPEIVDLVFQHAIQDVPVLHWKLESQGKRLVRYHRYILGRLCLVSRRWSEVFRLLLFHTMLFSKDGDLQRASNIPHPQPELSGGIFVRTLWIRPRMLDLGSKEHPPCKLGAPSVWTNASPAASSPRSYMGCCRSCCHTRSVAGNTERCHSSPCRHTCPSSRLPVSRTTVPAKEVISFVHSYGLGSRRGTQTSIFGDDGRDMANR